MYPKGCKLIPNTTSKFRTNAQVRIFRNGEQVRSFTASESDNYGFVNQVWAPGNYSVFVRPSWHSDDVKDYTFRIYAPRNITITQVQYATLEAAQVALNEFSFQTAKASVATMTLNTAGNIRSGTRWVS